MMTAISAASLTGTYGNFSPLAADFDADEFVERFKNVLIIFDVHLVVFLFSACRIVRQRFKFFLLLNLLCFHFVIKQVFLDELKPSFCKNSFSC